MIPPFILMAIEKPKKKKKMAGIYQKEKTFTTKIFCSTHTYER